MGFPEAPIPVQGHRFPLRPAFPFPLPLLLRPPSFTLPPGPPQASPAGRTLLSPGAGAARAGLLLPGGGPGGRWLLGAGSCHRSSGRSPRVSPPGLRLPHSPPSAGSRARLSDPRKIFLLVFFPFPPPFFSRLLTPLHLHLEGYLRVSRRLSHFRLLSAAGQSRAKRPSRRCQAGSGRDERPGSGVRPAGGGPRAWPRPGPGGQPAGGV